MNNFKDKEQKREQDKQLSENGSAEQNIIRGTQRSDGSFRKDIKIREGFVNTFIAERYKIPQRRGEGAEVNEGIDMKTNWRNNTKELIKHTEPQSNLGWRATKQTETSNINKKVFEKQTSDKFNSIDNEFPNLADDKTNEVNNHGQISNSGSKQSDQTQKNEIDKTRNLNVIHFSNAAKEKEQKKLSKKLREIEALEQRQSQGLELQPEAAEKVSKKDDIVKMLEKLSLQDSQNQ